MESMITPAVLLLDLPDKALGGIDLLSFTTAPRFRGIKNLPPGLHLVFTGTTSTLSIRHGAWFIITNSQQTSPPELLIKKWDAQSETLVQETQDSEVLRHRANLGAIWREGLAPYRQTASKDAPSNTASDADGTVTEESHAWRDLSSHITAALLTHILGDTPNHWSLTSSSAAKTDIDEIPGLPPSEDTGIPPEKNLNFLPIDLKQTWRAGATGRERTEAAQDRSWYLRSLISTHYNASSSTEDPHTLLLGELEFTFLSVLTLNNYSALQQWRRILSLILTCKVLIQSQPTFFATVLHILTLQLQHTATADGADDGTGLFDFADEDGTWLKALLVRFRRGLESLGPATSALPMTPVSQDSASEKTQALLPVFEALDELEDHLRSSHNWQFGEGELLNRHGTLELMDGERVEIDAGGFDEEDESGEFAPVVVDLTAEQARALGIEIGDGDGEAGLVRRASRLRLSSGAGDGTVFNEVESSDEEDKSEQGGSDGDEEEMDLEDMDERY